MDERDKDEIEAMDSGYVLGHNWPSIVSDSVDLHHRMKYIRQRNLGFSFITVNDKEFHRKLADIDANLPRILAAMLSDFYRNGTRMVSDLVENVQRLNPAEFTNVRESKIYFSIMARFLEQISSTSNNPTSGDILLEKAFFERIPAEKFGCASISGDIHSGYTTDLVLQIAYE